VIARFVSSYRFNLFGACRQHQSAERGSPGPASIRCHVGTSWCCHGQARVNGGVSQTGRESGSAGSWVIWRMRHRSGSDRLAANSRRVTLSTCNLAPHGRDSQSGRYEREQREDDADDEELRCVNSGDVLVTVGQSQCFCLPAAGAAARRHGKADDRGMPTRNVQMLASERFCDTLDLNQR
jgi:hypothetical protein